jgi:hypothetical protein
MRPKYEEIRRMIMLALGNWTDFLNTLNSILYSMSYLQSEAIFAEIYRESRYSDEVREALLLISSYWERHSEKSLALATIGLKFSKPHTRFEMTLLARYPDQKECARLVIGATTNIDSIEGPIMIEGLRCKKEPIDDLEESRIANSVLKYDEEMLNGLCIPEPYFRAGIELQLLRRGFTL